MAPSSLSQWDLCTIGDIQHLLRAWAMSRWAPPPATLSAMVALLKAPRAPTHRAHPTPAHTTLPAPPSTFSATPGMWTPAPIQAPRLASGDPAFSAAPSVKPTPQQAARPSPSTTPSRAVQPPPPPPPTLPLTPPRPPPPPGNKLRAASCAGLASISHSLWDLGALDSDLVEDVAWLAAKRASGGGVHELAQLTEVLVGGRWGDMQVGVHVSV